MVRFSRVNLHAGKELRRFAIEGNQLPVAGHHINFVTRVINGKPHRFDMIQRFNKLLLARIDNPQQPFVFAPDSGYIQTLIWLIQHHFTDVSLFLRIRIIA